MTTISLEQDIHDAIAVLRSGGLILYPTDTIWGIGCDASDTEAVRRVFALKRRADSKALIVLVADKEGISAHSAASPVMVDAIVTESLRPVTIVCPHGRDVSPLLLADDGSLGIRATSEEVSGKLCRAFGHPLVSTSANLAGEPSPRCFSDISPEILEGVDYVMHARRTEAADSHAIPSRIVKISDAGDEITILRE